MNKFSVKRAGSTIHERNEKINKSKIERICYGFTETFKWNSSHFTTRREKKIDQTANQNSIELKKFLFEHTKKHKHTHEPKPYIMDN